MSHEDAEDVLQEVFIRVYRNLDQFRGESSLSTWIYRIATNESLRLLNTRKDEEAIPAEEVQEELIGKLKASDYIDYENELAVKFQEAILSLPEKQRLIFNLRYYDELDYDCVLINNIQGAFNATNYLIQCGHKNVGYFHSSLDISNFSERADGYYKALRANGISTSHPYVHLVSPTSDEGYRDMLRLLESKAPIADAYFADNDIIAAAAMRALRENGYRIPEDVSIIGFDDVPMCDMMVPPLSTMKVRKRELGATAVQRLLDRVADPKRECLKMCMATKLVKRQSVSRR